MNSKMSFQPLNRPKLVDDVVNQLQKKISEGEIKPGDKIPTEPELMQQFAVGRSTIREAVRVLVHAGLLEKKQGFGTFLKAQSAMQEPLDHRLRRAQILEVYEVRRMLELEISRLAAERRDENDLEQMRSALDQRYEALEKGDTDTYLREDVKFHLSIAVASKNSVVIDLYRSFTSALFEASQKLIVTLQDPHHLFHENMYKAIKDKNVAEAEYWTMKNLDETVTQLKQFVNQE
ncbi:FadR/GntR family transcriptional regulator [Paenibacillus chondroitinus]|uniref:FadR/GntR family transcriptional regulator n=1 Tax=Paenibacillus chondroitinus TaxID=59842 RepID=A0ABU6D6E1_9BACL|nr:MULTISPECIES: FadR/GntR family transcriptional regulator [Paenibacillus]MCY9662580.1 FadR family transcriptional regulator [Paenibacillus anseongense]MEB4793305.1 FadR/GntR family transcriptional regulator [Paenibacillus chondroitinus]